MDSDLNDEARLARERRCIERVRRGDMSAFGEIYDDTAPLLFRKILLPRLGNVAAAEDALSETFRSALERIEQYEPRNVSIYFWLARIAHNKAMDLHRVRATTGRKLVDLRNLVEPLMKPAEDPNELLELATESHEMRTLIGRVLGQLNPRYRRAIELRFFDEKSRQQCAEELDVKVGTFDVLLLRALRAFRRGWELSLAATVEEPDVTR